MKVSIEISGENTDKWIFSVKIIQDEKEYQYSVFVSKDYYKELVNEKIPPVTLVERSFSFLLNREPPSSILKEFNLKQIEDYFSEYRKEIVKYL